MGHNFPAPTAEILSRPGAGRGNGNVCIMGFIDMWYSPHDGNITASLGILRRGKTAVKSVLSFTVWFICVSTWFIYQGPRSIISYFWSHEQLLSAGELSYAVLKYKCTQTSLSFWTCRHQSEIFVWHEVFYIKITHALWDGDSVTRAISWN